MIPQFELDHIGVAVSSIDAVLPFYKAMGWTEFPTEVVPTEKVKGATKKTCHLIAIFHVFPRCIQFNGRFELDLLSSLV